MKFRLIVKLFAFIVFGLIMMGTVAAQSVVLPKTIIVEQVPGHGICTYHEVGKGNTVYSIGKAYQAEVFDILEANPKKNLVNLQLEDKIRIPVSSTFIDDFNTTGDFRNRIPVYYKARKGDNLFRISRVYFDLSMEDVKKYNKLSNISLQPDQLVLVGYKMKNSALNPSEKQITSKSVENKAASKSLQKNADTKSEDKTVSKAFDKQSVKSLPKKNIETKSLDKETKGVVARKQEVKKPEPGIKQKEVPSKTSEEGKMKFEKIVRKSASEEDGEVTAEEDEAPPIRKLRKDNGVAIWNPGSQSTGIFALHRDAIPGSQLEVYNPFSRKSMSVTVIGGIPETAYQENVKVILSPETAKALGALDERFYVKMSYVK